jgi:hypothetical protein
VRARRTSIACIGALALIAAVDSTRVAAQDDSADAMAACIRINAIGHTQVLDDRNILFFMRNRVTYRNTLLGTCPGLRAENHFMYGQDVGNSLCKGNLINVLTSPTGAFGGFERGASCWLGFFQAVSDDEVADLVAAATPTRKNKDANRRQANKVEPVELPARAKPEPDAAPSTPAESPPAAEPAH